MKLQCKDPIFADPQAPARCDVRIMMAMLMALPGAADMGFRQVKVHVNSGA